MDGEKENDSVNTSVFSTPNNQFTSTPSGQFRNTPIRPLTSAYIAARSENEVCVQI